MTRILLALTTLAAVAGCYNRVEYTQQSSSMAPTIKPGEVVFADPDAYKKFKPARWDVVVFHPPSKPGQIWMFRIVGLPGESIDIVGGDIHIDGKAAPRPEYLESLRYESEEPDAPVRLPFKIPNSHYFVLGDNTDSANDSRFWGPLDLKCIIGQVLDK
jgi:signal peptidase I